jgi:hypothetical protein
VSGGRDGVGQLEVGSYASFGGRGWMTMTGLRRFLRIAFIIALALVNFVILGFAAYWIFLVVKWLIGHL